MSESQKPTCHCGLRSALFKSKMQKQKGFSWVGFIIFIIIVVFIISFVFPHILPASLQTKVLSVKAAIAAKIHSH